MAADQILVGKAAPLPYDIQTVQAALARRRAILDALAKQAMSAASPVIDAGNVKVANWGDAIGRLGDVLAYRQGTKALDQDEAAASQDYQKRLTSGVQDFMRAWQGTPGTTGQGVTGSLDQQDMPINPGQRGNPYNAVAVAMASGIPQVQAMGTDLQKEIAKNVIGPKDLLQYAHNYAPDAAANIATESGIPMGPEDFQPKPEWHQSEGVGYSTQNGKLVPDSKTPVNSFTTPVMSPEGTSVQTETTTNRQVPASGATSAPAKSGVSALYDAAMGDFGKELAAGKAASIEAVQKLPLLRDAMALTDQLNKGTPWSSLQQTGMKIAQGFGVPPEQLASITSTEQFNALMSQQALAIIKTLRPASDQDLKYATRLTATNDVSDPRTAKAMVALAGSVAVNTLLAHQKNIGRLQELGGAPGAGDLAQHLESLYAVPFSTGSPDNSVNYLRDLNLRSGTNDIVEPAAFGTFPGQPNAPTPPAGSPQGWTPEKEKRLQELRKKYNRG